MEKMKVRKLEVILSEMAVVFGKWSNARASLEKTA